MNTNLITALRTYLINNTTLTQCFTPSLPQTGENIACLTLLGGSTTNNLCNQVEYYDLQLRVLIRANESDTGARQLSDEIFNALHLLKDLSFTGGTVINCIANTPVFVGKDENQRILYNITLNIKVK
jgi:hypothetical protein